MNKKDIRNKIKKLRDSYSYNELETKSLKITNAFYKKYSYLNIFLLYYSIYNEVNTTWLIDKLFDEEKQIFLPSVYESDIIFKKYEGSHKLILGRYGIFEASGYELNVLPDIICVPGVVFDAECNRIGYGGGYYDRYLCKNNTIIKSAFAYDFQVIDKIETECYDIPVDEIFTESRIIRRG